MDQRAALNFESKADSDEAFMAGQAAVKAAVEGETDKMVILVRSEGESYACETGLAPLSEIANGVKLLPESWINEDGVSMNYNFIKYALPLIQGEVEVPFENGVPQYIELKKIYADKQLPAYTLNG
jgi:6-phosphofructokinase 1